jgi:hypothetical protein
MSSFVVLGQQRIEVAEPLDEAAVAGKARIGGDDVVDRALLGARAREADDDCHLDSPECCLNDLTSCHSGAARSDEPGIHNHDREHGFRARGKRRVPE